MTGILAGLVADSPDILTLTPDTISATNTVPGNATAEWRLSSDGGVYDRTNVGTWIYRYDWVTPTSSASKYVVVWTAVSGTVDNQPGTAGTELALTSTRDWGEVEPSDIGATDTATFTAKIRLPGGSDIVTANITLTATTEI